MIEQHEVNNDGTKDVVSMRRLKAINYPPHDVPTYIKLSSFHPPRPNYASPPSAAISAFIEPADSIFII